MTRWRAIGIWGLALLPCGVAFGALVPLALPGMQATITDVLVAGIVLAAWPHPPTPDRDRYLQRMRVRGETGSGIPPSSMCARDRRGMNPPARNRKPLPGLGRKHRNGPQCLIGSSPEGFLFREKTPQVSSRLPSPSQWRGARGEAILMLSLAALIVWMMLSLAWATSRAEAVKEILKWGEALAVLWAAPRLLRSWRDARWLVLAMLASGIVEALIGIAQGTIFSADLPSAADRGVRVVGTFGQPNPFSGYLNLTLPIWLALAAWGDRLRHRMLGVAGSAVTGVALALAQSRGATLALAAAMVVMAWAGWPRIRPWLAGVAAMAASAVGGLLLARRLTPAGMMARLGWRPLTNAALSANVTDANFSTLERLAHWAAALRMLAAHPLTGVGAGNYAAVYSAYAVPRWQLPLGHAHNLFLTMGADLGWPGLALCVIIAAAMLAIPLASARRGPRDWRAIAFLGIIVTVTVHECFDDLTTHSMLVQQMLVLICAQSLLFIRLHEESKPSQESEQSENENDAITTQTSAGAASQATGKPLGRRGLRRRRPELAAGQ